MGSSYTKIDHDGCADSMKKIMHVLGYFLLSNVIFTIDRVTKNYAIAFDGATTSVFPGFSFVYVKNRGISWGMLYAHNSWMFSLTAVMISVIIGILAVYTYQRWQLNRSIIGEVFVLTGAISNLIDRIVHAGVIDFIEISCCGWYFPVFNIADIVIVIGVGMMLTEFWLEP